MTKKTAQAYAVKDIALAEWGRKEIAIAETGMPGLMSDARRIRATAAAPVVRPHRPGSYILTIQTAS
jgi:adenosylhomocysteinase